MFNEVPWSEEMDWEDRKARMRWLAEREGGVLANEEWDLLPGDHFRLYVDQARGVADTVFVWDGLRDGFGWGHELVSGREAMFTGEDYVLRVVPK